MPYTLGVCSGCNVVKKIAEKDIEDNALCSTCEDGVFTELDLEQFL